MTYDKMGNILSIKRYGKLSARSFGLIDDLSLSYTGNQLQKVTDRVTQTVPEDVMHFTDHVNSNTEYTYDSNGNLLSDLNKNISKIEYNVLNLPEKITFSNGDWTGYVYDSGGNKLCVTHHIGQTTSVTDYAGSMIYENGILSKTLTENGYVSFSGTTPAYHYYLTDHLGNNRIVMNAAGSVEQVNHYYPFGGIIAESTGDEVQPWKYGGKELDETGGLNWSDFGSRNYDNILNRWHTLDPMAERYYSISPYVYCGDNPIMRIDPTGMIWDNPEEAEDLKKNIDTRISLLRQQISKAQEKINKGDLSKEDINELNQEISEATARIDNLNTSKNDIDLLGSDEDHVYAFDHIDGGEHQVYKGSEDGKIYIQTSSDAISIHEITHIRQSLKKGGLRFSPNKRLRNVGFRIPNKGQRDEVMGNAEVEAYQMQYSFDKSFPGTVGSRGLQGINYKSVSEIHNADHQLQYRYMYTHWRKINKK